MNIGRHVRAVTLSWLFVGSMDQHHAFGQAPLTTSPSQPSRALRDGQHDFDFNIGVWRTHYRRLLHPLAGSRDWIEFDGTVSVRKIWDETRPIGRDRSGRAHGPLGGAHIVSLQCPISPVEPVFRE